MYNNNKIIQMYKDIESEEHYDVEDISIIICKTLLNECVINNEGEYFRLIYDVFDVCKKYVKSTYDL